MVGSHQPPLVQDAHEPDFRVIVHTHTNENIYAIHYGLDLFDHHTILAVGGSGDQGFSMAVRNTVILIDTDPVQVGYMEFQRHNLEANHMSFLYPSVSGSSDGIKRDGERVVTPQETLRVRNEYFLPRMQTVSAHAPYVSIKEGDIWAAREEGIDRVYCSNAPFPEYQPLEKTIADVMGNLKADGLAYFTEGERILGTLGPKGLPHDVEIQESLTCCARNLERKIDRYVFSPLVLRKTL